MQYLEYVHKLLILNYFNVEKESLIRSRIACTLKRGNSMYLLHAYNLWISLLFKNHIQVWGHNKVNREIKNSLASGCIFYDETSFDSIYVRFVLRSHF